MLGDMPGLSLVSLKLIILFKITHFLVGLHEVIKHLLIVVVKLFCFVLLLEVSIQIITIISLVVLLSVVSAKCSLVDLHDLRS
jgi:hypothetical protein